MVKTAFGVSAASLVLLAGTALGPSVRAGDEPITSSKDFAPILCKNGTSCHRPGDMAPMATAGQDKSR